MALGCIGCQATQKCPSHRAALGCTEHQAAEMPLLCYIPRSQVGTLAVLKKAEAHRCPHPVPQFSVSCFLVEGGHEMKQRLSGPGLFWGLHAHLTGLSCGYPL